MSVPFFTCLCLAVLSGAATIYLCMRKRTRKPVAKGLVAGCALLTIELAFLAFLIHEDATRFPIDVPAAIPAPASK